MNLQWEKSPSWNYEEKKTKKIVAEDKKALKGRIKISVQWVDAKHVSIGRVVAVFIVMSAREYYESYKLN